MQSTGTRQGQDAQTGGATAFPHLFQPFQIGPMKLRNRVMTPPHSSAIGNLWGPDEKEAERTFAYWRSRVADGGPAWVGGVTGRVANKLIPGFEPHGYGAETKGYFRLPFYVERIGRFVDEMHSAGAVVTTQLTLLGGVPHAPSNRRSSTLYNHRPHVLRTDEIAEFVEEYRFSAGQARKAGLDGIELHLNHDDMLEWFLSPLTNQRDDAYGGSLENRARFAVEVLTAVREEIGTDMALGVRLNLREEEPGGYTEADGIEIAQYLESTGLLDFLHAVIGSPWGDPSYIQPYFYEPAQWADLAGRLRRAVSLPVVYSGRVNSVEVAEQVLADLDDELLVPLVWSNLFLVKGLVDLVQQRRHHLGIGWQRLLGVMDTSRARRRLVVLRVELSRQLHDTLKGKLARVPLLGLFAMLLQALDQFGDALLEGIVDDALVFEGLDLVSALSTLLMDLRLLGPDEGALVDVGMHLDV